MSQLPSRTHRVTQYRSPIQGIEAIELISNHSFPRHSHDQYGIGVLVAGAQRSWSGIGQVESMPGDVITVNPGEIHDGIPAGGCVRHWRMLYFDPAFVSQEMKTEASHEVEFVSPSLRSPELGKLVHELFNRVAADAGPLGIEETLIRVIMRLSPLAPRSAAPERVTPGIAKVRERIDTDPGSHLTLSNLAALSGISRYRLIRAFARELGATPHAYIVQRRVRLARQLLLSGEALADAALRAGFADQSHMTRAFLRQFGVTPGRYADGHV